MIYFSDWAEEDYRAYLRWFEVQQGCGNEAPFDRPMTLAAWFRSQSAEYRSEHATHRG